MAESMVSSAVVRGFAKALPARMVTNNDLAGIIDTSDQWIRQRTGIETRYWVEPPTATSDLAVEASLGSLAAASMPADSLNAVIAATLSPDHYFPGIGVQLQAKLGLPPIPAFDLRNQCSGFLYGLELATALVAAGKYERILLVGAEVHSTGLDISTRGRNVAVLFGDGAGSCIVESPLAFQDSQGGDTAFEFLGSELHSDGAYMKELWCQYPGSAHFPSFITMDLLEEGKIFPSMNGRIVFENAVKRMTEVSLALLKRLNLSPSDVSLFVPHQANLRINQMVGRYLNIPESRVFNTIQHYGNTTAATVPIGLTDAIAQQLIKSGDIVLSAVFGSGFTWGAAVLRAI